MDALELSLRNFLNIPYEELKRLNLEIKADRNARKPEDYFRNKLKKYLKEEEKLKALTVCFSDVEGRFHMLDYDKDFILDSSDNLTFDGSSIRGFTEQSQSDLRLDIDWTSFRWLPADVFGSGKVMIFADVKDREGKPYSSCFRSKLKILAEEVFKSEGLTALVSPEIEGFLVDGMDAEQNFDEKAGFKLISSGGYFHTLPRDTLKDFIDRSAEAHRALGFENEKDHPEVAPSQFELNYKYSDIVNAADQIQLYKLTCRQVAKNMGHTATFLPKPIMGVNGSGMHINLSLSKDGKNIFYSEKGENNVSDSARKVINSILYHAKDICLILNASVNAYRRLDPHFEAPNEIKVSPVDRGAMIRIPAGNEKSARIEIRSVAPDADPYLTLFVLLKLAIKGMKASKTESAKYEGVNKKREKLPGNIYDALRYFKNSDEVKELIGDANHLKYISLKEDVAHRSARDLGSRIKNREILDHHEVRNQMIWMDF
jgi:glutamine synthetase